MRKISITIILAVFMLIGTTINVMAEEYNIAGESNAIIKQVLGKAILGKAVGSQGYIKEVYTTISPASGDPYNTSAYKTFSPGNTIHFIIRFHLSYSDNYTCYVLVTNAGGNIVYLNYRVGDGSGGQELINEFTTASLSQGTYFMSALIFDNTTGEALVPTSTFPFVVE